MSCEALITLITLVTLGMNMENVFYGADAFNQDLGGWDVSSVSNRAIRATRAIRVIRVIQSRR